MSETLAERLRQITADDNDEADILFEAADEIERLRAENTRLREMLFKAFCDGFESGKHGGWVVGPSGEPWRVSETRAALSEAPPAMDADTARAWRESDGDHRGHVEDRNDAVRAAKLPFPLGARVRKKSGSQWQGRVVGYYSASRTKNGIAVESEREIGNVQVYPAEAFEIVPEDSQ